MGFALAGRTATQFEQREGFEQMDFDRAGRPTRQFIKYYLRRV
jgi:hypothetical protein